MKNLYSHTALLCYAILFIVFVAACAGPRSSTTTIAPDDTIATLEVQSPATKMPATAVPTKTMKPTPTASATPEPPVPTSLPVAKLYVLDVTRGNEAPSDLLEYVSFYQGGAGGAGDCVVSGPPAWISGSAYNNATVAAFPRTLGWSAFNFLEKPKVQALLTLPDGSKVPLDANVRGMGGGCLWVSYEIAPGAPLGRYAIKLKQGKSVLKDTFILEMPAEPIQTVYEGNDWFAGYKPNEMVTLSVYYKSSIFDLLQPETAALFPDLPNLGDATPGDDMLIYLDQQTVAADEYGAFQVKIESNEFPIVDDFGSTRVITVANGETSGYAPPETSKYRAVDFAQILSGSCNGSLPTRLAVGGEARVTDYGSPIPDYSDISMPVGTTVTVLYGPVCYGTGGWEWLVSIPDQSEKGVYVSEGDASGYFLEPVNP